MLLFVFATGAGVGADEPPMNRFNKSLPFVFVLFVAGLDTGPPRPRRSFKPELFDGAVELPPPDMSRSKLFETVDAGAAAGADNWKSESKSVLAAGCVAGAAEVTGAVLGPSSMSPSRSKFAADAGGLAAG